MSHHPRLAGWPSPSLSFAEVAALGQASRAPNAHASDHQRRLDSFSF
jgi:hypothetical protein